MGSREAPQSLSDAYERVPILIRPISFFRRFQSQKRRLKIGKAGGHPTIIVAQVLFIKGKHDDRDDRPT